jgi:hypothetical protein
MRGLWKLSAVALLGLATIVPAASAAPFHGRGPRVVVRGGFVYGPAWGYGPYYDPYWGAVGYSVPTTGDLKIKTPVKDASVFIDGGYVGLAGKVKEVPLVPGTHNLEMKAPDGSTIFQQDVGVVLGKTTEIHALS